MNSGGDKKLQYLQYCMHMINMLCHYQITPVVVFHGASIPCKSGTEQERHSKRKAYLELAMSKFKEGDAAAASELFQNVRLMYQTDNKLWGYNALKYFTTIVAVCTRTAYSLKDGLKWKIIAWVCSAVAAIFCTYWDIVIDWGILQRNSTNRWLRNKLVIPHKSGSCAQYANTQGEELREVIGASLYIECSAKTQQNLKGVFDAAIEVGLHSPNQKKKKISMAQKECSVL